VTVRKPSFLLASALALAALALPGAAAANESHTDSHTQVGTLTVQVESQGPHKLGWSALDFKLASCRLASTTSCAYSLIAVEIPAHMQACPEVLSKERVNQLNRVYLAFSEGESLRSGAHSFDSFTIEGGKATLCWYVPQVGSPSTQQIVATTTITASS
jgi:hypothetical protein